MFVHQSRWLDSKTKKIGDNQSSEEKINGFGVKVL